MADARGRQITRRSHENKRDRAKGGQPSQKKELDEIRCALIDNASPSHTPPIQCCTSGTEHKGPNPTDKELDEIRCALMDDAPHTPLSNVVFLFGIGNLKQMKINIGLGARGR